MKKILAVAIFAVFAAVGCQDPNMGVVNRTLGMFAKTADDNFNKINQSLTYIAKDVERLKRQVRQLKRRVP